MRGDLRAVSVRSLPRIPRPDTSAWITSLRERREGRQRRRLERLETIEQLERTQRRLRRAGEHVPERASIRRWC